MKVLELTDRAISQASIAAKRCFACGGASTSGSGEHVIPKWLQNECCLFDERLTLQNGTYIPYRNLTVPCCIDCNTGFLSSVESAVQPLFHRGDLMLPSDRLVLARWLSKILIGVLVKETASCSTVRSRVAGQSSIQVLSMTFASVTSCCKARESLPHSPAFMVIFLSRSILTRYQSTERIMSSISRQTLPDNQLR